MDRITSNFTLFEFFTGCTEVERKSISVNNLSNMFRIAMLLQQLRSWYAQPLIVTSCYRDIAHNKRAGGVSSSQHLTASAVDFKPKDIKHIPMLVEYIYKYFDFGQLIQYPTFIHLSLPDNKHHLQFIKK